MRSIAYQTPFALESAPLLTIATMTGQNILFRYASEYTIACVATAFTRSAATPPSENDGDRLVSIDEFRSTDEWTLLRLSNMRRETRFPGRPSPRCINFGGGSDTGINVGSPSLLEAITTDPPSLPAWSDLFELSV